jgi:2-phosphosulfolactate phosphatase
MGPVAATHDQAPFPVRFEWGEAGARILGAISDVVVVVDVLSFSTAVDVAVSRGATVFPFTHHGRRAAQFAARVGAVLAVDRHRVSSGNPYSLSPLTLVSVPAGTRLVLPSPNGSAISVLAAGVGRIVLAGCLRNASAVAVAARGTGGTVSVIAAGERWPNGSLRPAFEDLVGAGAIISHLPPSAWSPEAGAAVAAFGAVANKLPEQLMDSSSGRELTSLGFGDDVRIATELDVSPHVPRLVAGTYRAHVID